MLVRCRELGNPLGDKLSNLIAGNDTALIGGANSAINRGPSFGFYCNFFSANRRICMNGCSHMSTIALRGKARKAFLRVDRSADPGSCIFVSPIEKCS